MNRLALWVGTQRANTRWVDKQPVRRCGSLVATAALLAACGGPARYPAADVEPEPQTVDEALRQLANAKHALGIADSPSASTGGEVKQQPTLAKPPPYNNADPLPQPMQPTTPASGTAASPPASAPRDESKVATAEARSGSRDSDAVEENTRVQCTNSCRALASIKRASEALCRMTAESDERCIAARKTLVVANERTAACACQQ